MATSFRFVQPCNAASATLEKDKADVSGEK